jgi:hypothetical protein
MWGRDVEGLDNNHGVVGLVLSFLKGSIVLYACFIL